MKGIVRTPIVECDSSKVSARLKGRWREVERILPQLHQWALGVDDPRAIAVVGSFAYRAPRLGSDLDLVLPHRDQTATAPGWAPPRRWGPHSFFTGETGDPYGSCVFAVQRGCIWMWESLRSRGQPRTRWT